MIQFKNKHVTIFRSAIYQTTATVVETGDLLLVVDPNMLPAEIQTIRQFADELLTERKRPVYLLFTHSHYDHIIGYNVFPEAKVIASRAFIENRDKQSDIEDMLKWDEENFILRSYPIEYPKVDFEVEKDRQIMTVGNTKLIFYLAPGHNKDGIFTIVEPVGVWLAGDYLSEIEFPLFSFSSKAYEETLAKVDDILASHQVHLLVPGHGREATERTEILARKKESLDYIYELRQCLAEDKTFDEEKLWRRYRFPRGLKKFHEENVGVIKKELGK